MSNFSLPMGEQILSGDHLGTLRDANDLLGDVSALHNRMDKDGYLLIRGLHKREKVLAARAVLLENLAENGQIDSATLVSEGVIAAEGRGRFGGGRTSVQRLPEVLSVLESPEITGFFDNFLQTQSMTFDWKWVRAVGHKANTGAHYDIVYMGRGTRDLYSCWTPMGDIPYEMGPLAILVGSHRFDAVRKTYGQMDVDRDKVEGWFTKDPIEVVDRHGGQWRTTQFMAGDAVIFPMFTMHGSINNQTHRYRLSCDTRYQRADEPADPRWMGKEPTARDQPSDTEVVSPMPIETARQEWGV